MYHCALCVNPNTLCVIIPQNDLSLSISSNVMCNYTNTNFICITEQSNWQLQAISQIENWLLIWNVVRHPQYYCDGYSVLLFDRSTTSTISVNYLILAERLIFLHRPLRVCLARWPFEKLLKAMSLVWSISQSLWSTIQFKYVVDCDSKIEITESSTQINIICNNLLFTDVMTLIVIYIWKLDKNMIFL